MPRGVRAQLQRVSGFMAFVARSREPFESTLLLCLRLRRAYSRCTFGRAPAVFKVVTALPTHEAILDAAKIAASTLLARHRETNVQRTSQGTPVLEPSDLVLLLDVDNTLLDNDRFVPISEHASSRRSARRSVSATGRSTTRCATNSAMPTTWERCRSFVPGSMTARICCKCLPSCSSIRSPLACIRARLM